MTTNKVTIEIDTKKEWWKSKTIWANIGLVIAGLALDLLNVVNSGGAFTAAAILNLVLRSVSKHELVFK